MKYFLYSKKNVILQIDSELTDLPAGKVLEIQTGSLVNVFSTERNFLPFAFKTEKPELFKNDYIKIIEYPKFLMLEILPLSSFSPVFLKGKNFKEYTVCLIGKPYKLMIDHKLEHYVFDCQDDIKNVDFFEKGNAIFMQAELNNDDYTVIFHKKNKKFQEFIGNFNFSDKDNKISVLKDKHTFFRHGELQVYEIQDEKILQISSEPVYLNGKPAQPAPFLSHIAFFQAVKEKDLSMAKQFLSKKFSYELTPNLFEQFFGKFDEIKPILDEGEHKIALIENLSPRHSFARVFKIKISSNLIDDIIED